MKNLLAISLCLAATCANADVLTIRADQYCPLNCAPGSSSPGFMIDIANEIFGKAGHKVDYKLMGWQRAIAEGKAGNIHAIVGALKDDAPDFIYPANEQGRSMQCFYTLKDHPWQFDGLASLSKITLGTINGYSYGEELDAYIKAHEKDGKVQMLVANDEPLVLNIRKLQGKRVDAIVEAQPVAIYTLKQQKATDTVHEAGCEKKAQDIFIAFSPKHPKSHEYAELLSKGMQDLRNSGHLSKILARYGLKDWR